MSTKKFKVGQIFDASKCPNPINTETVSSAINFNVGRNSHIYVGYFPKAGVTVLYYSASPTFRFETAKVISNSRHVVDKIVDFYVRGTLKSRGI